MSDQFFALAIAGGRGERLRPLTDSVPKPMISLNGRPMISYQVEWMRSQGVTDVVFLCGYLGNVIKDYFGDGRKFGINAHYSFEDKPLGRGGAVRKGMSLVPSDSGTVLVTRPAASILSSTRVSPVGVTRKTMFARCCMRNLPAVV